MSQPEGVGALGVALEKSHDVQERVEACAEELGAANDSVKKHIDQGATTLSAAAALKSGERVEAKVQDCANDLNEVTEHLAQGIEELERVEGALARPRAALADTELALEKEVARRLQQFAREGETAWRNGGDEFLVLLMNPKGRANAWRFANALHQDITRPMAIAGVERVVGVSIGIALYPLDALTGDSLVALADGAMYRPKLAGGGCVMQAPGMPALDA